jgi:hypothetical protein
MSLELAGARKAGIKNGAFYIGPGLKEGLASLAPLIQDPVLCGKVFDDTTAWIMSKSGQLVIKL